MELSGYELHGYLRMDIFPDENTEIKELIRLREPADPRNCS